MRWRVGERSRLSLRVEERGRGLRRVDAGNAEEGVGAVLDVEAGEGVGVEGRKEGREIVDDGRLRRGEVLIEG